MIHTDPEGAWGEQIVHLKDELIWGALMAYKEGFVDSFSYRGIKMVYELWDKFCDAISIFPDNDYSAYLDFEDMLYDYDDHRNDWIGSGWFDGA